MTTTECFDPDRCTAEHDDAGRHPEPPPEASDAAMAFVDWCRTNHATIVHDRAIVHRVMRAYGMKT